MMFDETAGFTVSNRRYSANENRRNRGGYGKLSLFCFLFCALSVTGLFCGCASGRYYQAEAAQSAREFLLANAPELSPDQIYFVKYNDPFLLTSPVLGEGGGGFVSEEEQMSSLQEQICVTWNIPGSRWLYMVFGVSDHRMFSWKPLRLIRKDFLQQTLPEDAAIAACRKFAVDSLYHSLSAAELNRIRFSAPVILRTRFPHSFTADPKKTAEDIEKEKEQLAEKFQYALVWKHGNGKNTLFCGAASLDMAGWSINFAGNITSAELEKNTVGVVRTPEQQHRALVPLAADVERAKALIEEKKAEAERKKEEQDPGSTQTAETEQKKESKDPGSTQTAETEQKKESKDPGNTQTAETEQKKEEK